MQSAKQYRDFADECRRLMKGAKTDRQRTILEEMARTWIALAEETERKETRNGFQGS
jgi:hypothetical protein